MKTFFMYSDEGLIAEFDSIGNEIKSYGWKPGSTWGTDPVFMRSGGEYYFYHNDHLGTPWMMTSVTGNVVWKAEYEAFGKADVTVGLVENNLRFPGQYFDSETRLHYNWNRYYEPNSGRYISEDPIGLDGGLNLYGYVGNNPISLVDPKGLNSAVWEEFAKEISALPIPAAKIIGGLVFAGIVAHTVWENWHLAEDENNECPKDPEDSKEKVDDTVKAIDDYIGPDGEAIVNDSGDLVIISKDGNRRVRFDIKNPSPHENVHGHVEEKVGNRWKKSGPIYPNNVPQK